MKLNKVDPLINPGLQNPILLLNNWSVEKRANFSGELALDEQKIHTFQQTEVTILLKKLHNLPRQTMKDSLLLIHTKKKALVVCKLTYNTRTHTLSACSKYKRAHIQADHATLILSDA